LNAPAAWFIHAKGQYAWSLLMPAKTADILSLSKARKAKARTAKEQQAEQNRVLHGRTKAEKEKDAAEKALTEKRIEAHRLEPVPITALKPCEPGSDA
jgi:Domain of unknown function (DUF4169)